MRRVCVPAKDVPRVLAREPVWVRASAIHRVNDHVWMAEPFRLFDKVGEIGPARAGPDGRMMMIWAVTQGIVYRADGLIHWFEKRYMHGPNGPKKARGHLPVTSPWMPASEMSRRMARPGVRPLLIAGRKDGQVLLE